MVQVAHVGAFSANRPDRRHAVAIAPIAEAFELVPLAWELIPFVASTMLLLPELGFLRLVVDSVLMGLPPGQAIA